MNEISLIYNTGIQFYELPEDLLIDLNSNVVKAQRFYEFKFKDKVFLDPTYYFPDKDKYLKRSDLKAAGLIDAQNKISAEYLNPAVMN